MKSFEIIEVFPVPARTIFDAWLNSKEHSAMTGGEAFCSDAEGDSFSAWDGYISGTNKELVEGKKIVQSWRTSEFKDSVPDSLLTIKLENTNYGCRLTLIHSNIPDGQPDYEQGWAEHYFKPMKEYFST